MISIRNPKWLPLLLFLGAAHLLYAPAWHAGWVRDVTGWLESIHTQTVAEYLMRHGKRVQSLYPFTQAVLWFVYELFGVNPLAWHVLMVSMHATCAWGWMRLVRRLLHPTAPDMAVQVGLFAGSVFLLSPYATEVVVWEAGFHYMLAMLLQLGVLWCVLRWISDRKPRWCLLAVLLFLPTLASLEVFLLTPVFTALLILWGRYSNCITSRKQKQAVLWFVAPMAALCGLQYGVYRLFYTRSVPHIGALNTAWIADYMRKPGKYLFHLALGGRYWPDGAREAVYSFLNSPAGVAMSFGALALAGWMTLRKKAAPALRVAGIFYGFFLAAGALVIPLHFHESGLVYFDRYAYFMVPPAAALAGLAIWQLPFRKLFATLYLFTGTALLLGTVLLWRSSDRLSHAMLTTLPPTMAGTTTVLLNIPNALKGVPMIGATKEGEAALMRRYVYGIRDSGILLEPTACNLINTSDSVIIRHTGTLALRVFLQNGQGWWSGGIPTESWGNGIFSLATRPFSNSYNLNFKTTDRTSILFWQTGSWHRFLPGTGGR